MFIEICLKVVRKLINRSVISSKDETSDLPDIDFDFRDRSPMDKSVDKTNHRELSTLPDCGNSLQRQ